MQSACTNLFFTTCNKQTYKYNKQNAPKVYTFSTASTDFQRLKSFYTLLFPVADLLQNSIGEQISPQTIPIIAVMYPIFAQNFRIFHFRSSTLTSGH